MIEPICRSFSGGGDHPLLVKKFKADPSSVLLGVMSLWQGVDVPGDACQLVVVDRLPFPRPDEPLSAARAAAADAAGGSGFATVSVPHAAIRLAQGVGRLIRTGSDKGVAAVLDPRLHTARSYGPYLRKTLPPLWYTTDADKVHGALGRLSGRYRTLRGLKQDECIVNGGVATRVMPVNVVFLR